VSRSDCAECQCLRSRLFTEEISLNDRHWPHPYFVDHLNIFIERLLCNYTFIPNSSRPICEQTLDAGDPIGLLDWVITNQA
jgi:hypothetical protein